MKPAKILADYDVTIESWERPMWALLMGSMVDHVRGHVRGQLADEADGEREAAMPHEKQEESLPAIP